MKNLTAGLLVIAMSASAAIPAHAQQADMSDADIYALLMDCSAAEVLLTDATEGTPESAEHDKRAGNFIRASKAFSAEGVTNDDLVDDLVASGKKIEGWVAADNDMELGAMLGKCERIYPVVEENFSN